MTLVKQSKFAELCEVSRQAVTNWRNAGQLVMHGALVDVEATHARMRKFRKGGSPLTGKTLNGVSLGTVDRDQRAFDIEMTAEATNPLFSELDDTLSFDFTRPGLQRRVSEAARLLGFEPVFAGDGIDFRRNGKSHFLCADDTFDENAYCALDMLRWWLGSDPAIPSDMMPAIPLLTRPFGSPATVDLCENGALP